MVLNNHLNDRKIFLIKTIDKNYLNFELCLNFTI